MYGTMQDRPLTLDHFLYRAEGIFPDKHVVTNYPTGRVRRSYGDWADRTRRLAAALDTLKLSDDARVGTFAWNSGNHLELYFGIPCTGRVLHTLNLRLFPDQLTYIVNHAEDEAIFVDRSLLGLIGPRLATFETVKHLIIMNDVPGDDVPDVPSGWAVHDYEALIAAESPAALPEVDERRAASMCYTSGTTGNPKGVVYTHRSTFLHTLGALTADSLGATEADRILPVVPMFHANAWGLAHAGVACGADLIMPGPDLTPPTLAELIESERVTIAAGVPTIWMGVLNELDGRDVSSLRSVPCGGSAVPQALSEAFRAKIGLPILQAWGMTETSPIASVCRLRSEHADLDEDVKAELRATQGIPSIAVELRIIGPDGEPCPPDGESSGELQARGPWITGSYYNDDRSAESFTDDGWLRTGDVAVTIPEGYIRLVDRTKDVIKSGGEWISSVDLENEVMAHPAVAEAAVIGLPHSKWSERPVACVVVRPGETLEAADLLTFLEDRVAKWWLPDEVFFIDEVPKTSVGKFSKATLRQRFEGHRLATDV